MVQSLPYCIYECSVFGLVVVFMLPDGSFLHWSSFFNVHFISELPF
jgi:hypothetical protein